MKAKEESEKADFKHSKNEDHGIRSNHFMANRGGNSDQFYSLAPKSLWTVIAATKLKDLATWKKGYD